MNNTIEEIKEVNVVYYNLNHIAKYVVESKNPYEYVKKISTKIKENSYYKITENNLITLLNNQANKSKIKAIEYLQLIKNKQVIDGIVENPKINTNIDTIEIVINTFNFEKYNVDYIVSYFAVIKKSKVSSIKIHKVSFLRKIRDFTFIYVYKLLNR
jgi:hypothetical protein